MSIVRRTLFAAVFAAPFLFGQSPSDNEVRKAEEAWATAVKAGDRAALGNLMSDDLIYTHSTGLVETKTQYLDKLKSGDQKYAGLEYSGMKVRSWGNAGVVNTQVRMTGATKGVPFDNTVLLLHVWVKQGSGWKLVTHQTTRKAQ